MSGYSTRDLRPAPAPAPRQWKYANTRTGRVEFHATEQTSGELRLVRAPAGSKPKQPTGDDDHG